MIIFDKGKEFIDESLFLIKQEITKSNEKLEQINNDLNKNNKLIIKFNKALETTDEVEAIRVIAKRLADLENKSGELNKEKAAALSGINNLNEKYTGTELEKVYYNTTEKIMDFFNNMNIEEQRSILIKKIKRCHSFNNTILIDTGTVIFIFNTKLEYKFNEDMLKDLNKDIIYKKYFIETLTEEKILLDITDQFRENEMKNKIFEMNEHSIYDCKLKENKAFNNRIAKLLFEKYNISYDFSNHSNIVSFITDF
jgi:predicted RNase H-like nuclease (RuvC/YqgF family)